MPFPAATLSARRHLLSLAAMRFLPTQEWFVGERECVWILAFGGGGGQLADSPTIWSFLWTIPA